MTDHIHIEDQIRSLITQWEEATRDEPISASTYGVISGLRDLLPASLPDPLFGARATHLDHGEGIVTSHHPDEDGEVRFMFPYEGSGDGSMSHWVSPSTLTFHTPDHPEFLETEEDYANAPEGTVVASDNAWPHTLTQSRWEYPHQNFAYHEDMAGTRRRVLRWGWPA